MNKKKLVIVITLLAIVVCVCLSPVIFTEDRLSKEERRKYVPEFLVANTENIHITLYEKNSF